MLVKLNNGNEINRITRIIQLLELFDAQTKIIQRILSKKVLIRDCNHSQPLIDVISYR